MLMQNDKTGSEESASANINWEPAKHEDPLPIAKKEGKQELIMIFTM